MYERYIHQIPFVYAYLPLPCCFQNRKINQKLFIRNGYNQFNQGGILMSVDYFKRISSAIDFMETNIHEEISLESISRHVGLSPFHFHRIFHSILGETITEYVKSAGCLSLPGTFSSRTNESLTSHLTMAMSHRRLLPEPLKRCLV